MQLRSANLVWLIAFVLISVQPLVMAGEAEFLIMPKQLVLEAKKHDCEQIKDFFLVASVYGPPFVYGIVKSNNPSRYYGLNSAAFWCRKRGAPDRYLLVAIADEDVRDLFKCPNLVIELRDYIGALSVQHGTWELNQFKDVKTGLALKRKSYSATAIVSTAEAYEDIFLCHDGRWVQKERD